MTVRITDLSFSGQSFIKSGQLVRFNYFWISDVNNRYTDKYNVWHGL